MREIEITCLDAGTRLDRYLTKYLPDAPAGFVYKMLRKKNIKRNGKKAEGAEKLSEGDILTLYLAEETIKNFMVSAKPKFIADRTEEKEGNKGMESGAMYAAAGEKVRKRATKKPDGRNFQLKDSILYEDTNLLILNKAAGVLSQKARPADISLVEYITEYLLAAGAVTEEALRTFHPGVCNRLDRNTSGIVVAGKTSEGLRRMGGLFKERDIGKYYLTMVKGRIDRKEKIEGYLKKDHSHNRVTISRKPEQGAERIQTEYLPLRWNDKATLLKVHLITGKSHQIRAHLSDIGHPVAGDGKYGDVGFNRFFEKTFQLHFHLLHARELVFPVMDAPFSRLSEKVIQAPLPDYFEHMIESLF